MPVGAPSPNSRDVRGDRCRCRAAARPGRRRRRTTGRSRSCRLTDAVPALPPAAEVVVAEAACRRRSTTPERGLMTPSSSARRRHHHLERRARRILALHGAVGERLRGSCIRRAPLRALDAAREDVRVVGRVRRPSRAPRRCAGRARRSAPSASAERVLGRLLQIAIDGEHERVARYVRRPPRARAPAARARRPRPAGRRATAAQLVVPRLLEARLADQIAALDGRVSLLRSSASLTSPT